MSNYVRAKEERKGQEYTDVYDYDQRNEQPPESIADESEST
jgi:hypothetical protein